MRYDELAFTHLHEQILDSHHIVTQHIMLKKDVVHTQVDTPHHQSILPEKLVATRTLAQSLFLPLFSWLSKPCPDHHHVCTIPVKFPHNDPKLS